MFTLDRYSLGDRTYAVACLCPDSRCGVWVTYWNGILRGIGDRTSCGQIRKY